MSELLKILSIIERIKHYQETTIEELNARIWCFLHELEYIGYEEKDVTCMFEGDFLRKEKVFLGRSKEMKIASIKFVPEYTKSRDLIKSIRPKGGVWIELKTASDGDAICKFGKLQENGKEIYCFDTSKIDFLPSEELAELWCVLQAIEWERNNGK